MSTELLPAPQQPNQSSARPLFRRHQPQRPERTPGARNPRKPESDTGRIQAEGTSPPSPVTTAGISPRPAPPHPPASPESLGLPPSQGAAAEEGTMRRKGEPRGRAETPTPPPPTGATPPAVPSSDSRELPLPAAATIAARPPAAAPGPCPPQTPRATQLPPRARPGQQEGAQGPAGPGSGDGDVGPRGSEGVTREDGW